MSSQYGFDWKVLHDPVFDRSKGNSSADGRWILGLNKIPGEHELLNTTSILQLIDESDEVREFLSSMAGYPILASNKHLAKSSPSKTCANTQRTTTSTPHVWIQEHITSGPHLTAWMLRKKIDVREFPTSELEGGDANIQDATRHLAVVIVSLITTLKLINTKSLSADAPSVSSTQSPASQAANTKTRLGQMVVPLREHQQSSRMSVDVERSTDVTMSGH
ncbi:uncharacterized protein PAC_08501 [Phialocephala subalpina]|uniref:Uncharacterized protein n=1 Tax=Phialocephala subalpina TaxID=576137 RepID=A0A1L7X0T0_9HELO|nr:uncharacterized protein PAC_08501 [Phialocephala subalpina]